MPAHIAIYFSSPQRDSYPLDDPEYIKVYAMLSRLIAARGGETFVVHADTYRGGGRFSRGWVYCDGQLADVSVPIRADVIFNRDDKNTIPRITDCPILNVPEFDELCTDKLATARKFSDISPRTERARSYDEALACIARWGLAATDRVVFKENFQYGGYGIHILLVKDLTPDLYSDWSAVLIQEFYDSSCGIPGIIGGIHDLRIILYNCEPLVSIIRTPRAGSLLCNVSQGGAQFELLLAGIPPAALELTQRIHEDIRELYPAIYSVDMMNTPHGFKLTELNSRPGFTDPDVQPGMRRYLETAARLLCQMAGSKK